ncbi:helix-turn-helix domain-containing protein [Tannerella sp.]|uniref:helix-turn-helix domain-containing protein n=1 Tax=Tannerella sp. TaxID=2382127 RepID=UPI003FA2F4C0
MRERFGMKPEIPDLSHNGDVCRILSISKRTLQHYRDKGIIPYTQIAGKIFYRLSDFNRLLQDNYRSQSKSL